jgi:murein DD-endopeptidase MepM/ murein hydrolase activator NlpD
MARQPQQGPKPEAAAQRGFAGLRAKLTSLLPPMWRGNHPDMPLLIHNRIWFLRESRFLFFTRNGPIEITLKPTMVLAAALAGMVGVSVIFLSTIFASYSALEMMRDETIQTAEASLSPPDKPASTPSAGAAPWKAVSNDTQIPNDKANIVTGDLVTGDLVTGDLVTGDLVTDDLASGKTATAAAPIISRMNAKPQITSPSSVELFGIRVPSLPAMELQAAQTADMPAPLPDENSAETNPAVNNLADSDDDNSFARTAAGFAVAMLPRFLTQTEPVPNSVPEAPAKPKDPVTQQSDSASPPIDDGFVASRYGGRGGPLVPAVSEAARAKKLLMSLDNEISYIRNSITTLGIDSSNLPDYEKAMARDGQTDFKQVMITLAEHRAALRKIPFKPPMLYFYISSDYGMRTHPKSGKKTFHHGIDLAGTWQENVRATAPGTVVFAGREGSFGKVVRIEHEFGISTLYAHLARITVTVGDYVGENAVIGKMGNTGKSAGPHLHYEVQVDGRSVDPNAFFTIGRQISVAGELRQTSLTD